MLFILPLLAQTIRFATQNNKKALQSSFNCVNNNCVINYLFVYKGVYYF
jgi:hypothetical protein